MQNDAWRAALEDKQDMRQIFAALLSWEYAGLPREVLAERLESIYDLNAYEDLYSLVWLALSMRTPHGKWLSYRYDALRPDDFTGWDAPVTYVYKGRNGLKRLSDGGLQMPNRGELYDNAQAPNTPLVTIRVTGEDNLPALRLTIESIYHYSRGIAYELYVRDGGSVRHDIMGYYERLPNKFAVWRQQPEWRYNQESIYGREPTLNNAKGRYVVDVAPGMIVTPRWLHNLLVVVEADEMVGAVAAHNAWPEERSCPLLPGVHAPLRTIHEVLRHAESNNHSNYRMWTETVKWGGSVRMIPRETTAIIGYGYDSRLLSLSAKMVDYGLRMRQSGLKIIRAEDCFCHGLWRTAARSDSRWRQEADEEAFAGKHRMYAHIEAHLQHDQTAEKVRDPFDDMWNALPERKVPVAILGIHDAHCLRMIALKNSMVRAGATQVAAHGHAFNTDELPEMRLFCGSTSGGSGERLAWKIAGRQFDAIYLGGFINEREESENWLRLLLAHLTPEGRLYVHYENPFYIGRLTGEFADDTCLFDINYPELLEAIERQQGKVLRVQFQCVPHHKSSEVAQTLSVQEQEADEVVQRLNTKSAWMELGRSREG